MDVCHTHARKRTLGELISLDREFVKEGERGRKKQVVHGSLDTWTSVAINILFYTQQWPTLCLNLFGLAPASVVWVYSPATVPQSLVPSLPSDIKWVSRTTAAEVSSRDECHWIILQGSCQFVEEALAKELKSRVTTAWVLCVIPSQRIKRASLLKTSFHKWYRLKHAEIGGVSSSQWLIGLGYPKSTSVGTLPGREWITNISTFGLARRFGDVLKCSEGGEPVVTPTKPLPGLVHLAAVRSKQFVVPSFKSYSGWATRKLSFLELGSIFDFSELTLKVMEEAGEARSIFSEHAPPLKVCHAIKVLVLAVMTNLQPTPDQTTPRQVPSDIPKVTSHREKDFGLLQNILPVQDPQDAAAIYLQEYGDKAAKGEDARIPTELWDGHLFRHYFPSLKYEFAVHGKALVILREKFMFRLLLQTTTRSFTRYLIMKYGRTWLAFYLDNRRLYLAKGCRKRKRGSERVGDVCESKKFHNLAKDMSQGFEALTRMAKSSWWEWKGGSSLLFWRWPREIREAARDGYPICIRKKLPRWIRTQRLPREIHIVRKIKEKFVKVLDKGYVAEGPVRSMINCFPVEKGDDDIRLVYDGTKSGLNECVWAPNFFLPSVDSMLMNINISTWCADLDLTEMFLNYDLHKELRPYAGVDYTAVMGSETTLWLQWRRMFMGFTPSPYVTGKLFGWTIDVILGDRWDRNNPFRWESIRMNLPGMLTYDPREPRACKMFESNIAAALEAYVDDLRLLGWSELHCHAATSRAAKLLQYLGQQNATRKYRPPHTKPGPWCGSFVALKDSCVWVYTSQEKWNKAKRFIIELHNILATPGDVEAVIDYKFLERGRGFMIYFCRTYTSFVPYLKGMHLTMDSWREGRDKDGWKMKMGKESQTEEEEEPSSALEEELGNLLNREPLDPITLDQVKRTVKVDQSDHPEDLRPATRLKQDVEAFKALLSQDQAPWRFVRGGRLGVAHYGFGDASKSGFGSSIGDSDGKLWFRLGIWGSDESNESSNFRELANLVQTLQEYNVSQSLKGIELILFTDNVTAEAAFFRGSSKSRKLFELVLELRQLEVRASCKINFIHVAGTRMIAQGTDGLSRGDLNEGVMKGDQLSTFIPLHLSALERQENLKEWIKSFVTPAHPREEIIFLDAEGWFERAHDIVGGEENGDGVWVPNYISATYIWTPPPAAAQIAIEQLRRARLKREASTHVVIIPRLMTPEWRKQLFKVSDLCIELPFGEYWNKDLQHEPLTFAVVFPFLSHSPWQLKRSQTFLALGNVLRRMWKDSEIPTGSLLHQLFCIQRRLPNLSPGLVRKMLQGPGEFGLLHPQGTERGESGVEEEGRGEEIPGRH